jgi:hypothetical protein
VGAKKAPVSASALVAAAKKKKEAENKKLKPDNKDKKKNYSQTPVKTKKEEATRASVGFFSLLGSRRAQSAAASNGESTCAVAPLGQTHAGDIGLSVFVWGDEGHLRPRNAKQTWPVPCVP